MLFVDNVQLCMFQRLCTYFQDTFPEEYSGFHFFYAKLWTVAYEKPLVKKVWKKIWKIMWWSALLPKIKTRWPSLQDPGKIHHPHFWRTLGGIFTSCLPSYGPVGTTTSLGSVRRLPTRSAAPVSLDRPPLSPRLSARWTQCDDHLLLDHVRERCGQGERRRLMHLTRSGLAPGWPPWWKWFKERHLQSFWPLLFDFFLERKVSLAL